MSIQRRQVIVRMPPELHATVKTVARRLGLSVNDYIVARIGADAAERAGTDALTDRIDALETALTAALADRDERLSEALDSLADRITTAAHTDTDALADRIATSVQAAVGAPGAGVTVSTLKQLSHSIESVIQRELSRLARGEYRPTHSTTKKA